MSPHFGGLSIPIPAALSFQDLRADSKAPAPRRWTQRCVSEDEPEPAAEEFLEEPMGGSGIGWRLFSFFFWLFGMGFFFGGEICGDGRRGRIDDDDDDD